MVLWKSLGRKSINISVLHPDDCIACTLHYPEGLNIATGIGVFRRDDDVFHLSRNMLH